MTSIWTFTSDSDVISWVIIKAFVISMRNLSRRGFTGRFFAFLYNPPTGMIINVGLRILKLQEPSESVGSN